MPGELTATFGNAVTLTVATAVLLQLPLVPVTVYVVVVVKAAVVGFDTAAKPPVQLYVVAPLATGVAVKPEQIVGELTATFGNAVTLTVATAVPVQLPVVPVTVYIVVVVNAGVVGFDTAVKPPVHVYVVAPLATGVAVKPEQMVGELTPTLSAGFTVTVATAVLLQPSLVPVTVYIVVVVNAGVVGFDTAVKPPVHVYVVAPLATGVAVDPEHIVGELTNTVGFGFTRIDFVAATLAFPDLYAIKLII
jgi:Holliday junction resolvasome RuvABC endonuclease subunit